MICKTFQLVLIEYSPLLKQALWHQAKTMGLCSVLRVYARVILVSMLYHSCTVLRKRKVRFLKGLLDNFLGVVMVGGCIHH